MSVWALEFGWQSCYGTWMLLHCTVLHSHWTNRCQVLCTNRKYLHTHKSMYTSCCWTAIHTKADTTDAQPRLLLLFFFCFFFISRKQNVEKMQTQNLTRKRFTAWLKTETLLACSVQVPVHIFGTFVHSMKNFWLPCLPWAGLRQPNQQHNLALPVPAVFQC